MPSFSYCASMVRAHDYDRYLCTLFAPAAVREAWFTLFAFNHEIAVIGEVVSEEMLGHIRLAWWREALDEIYSHTVVRRHPVAQALAEVIHAYALPREPFDRLLEARARDLDPEPFASVEELEAYCRDTSATLLQLCNLSWRNKVKTACHSPAGGNLGQAPRLRGGDKDKGEKPGKMHSSEIKSALDELGTAWALTGMARAKNHKALPQIVALAEKHLEAARGAPPVFAAFLRTCEFYMRQLKAGKGDTPLARVRLMVRLWCA